VQRPEERRWTGFTVGQMRNRAVADDVAGVFQKTRVDAAMQRQVNLAGDEGMNARMARAFSASTCAARCRWFGDFSAGLDSAAEWRLHPRWAIPADQIRFYVLRHESLKFCNNF